MLRTGKAPMRINLPRNESFFPLFHQQSVILRDASHLLVEEARSAGEDPHPVAIEVLDLEQRGDALIREIVRRTNTTFVTAIEPEDVRLLASRLDDVLDGIEEVAYRIAAYRIAELPTAAVRLCEIIESCGQLIGEAVDAASERGDVLAQCAEINRFEDEADRLTRSAIAELLQAPADPLGILKLKEIYELLEGTVDRCEDVADALQSISGKNC